MKKTLLLTLALAVAASISAAGTLWTVPTDTLYAKTTLTTVPGVTLKFMDGRYSHQLAGAVPSVTLGGTTCDHAWQGTTNPTPWTHAASYAMWAFDVTTAGRLTVGFAINKTKKFYITSMPIMAVTGITYESPTWVEEYSYAIAGETAASEIDMKAYLATNNYYYGDYNGQTIGRYWFADSTAATGSWISETIDIQAEAGKSYCVFVTGSKLGFFGFNFEVGAAVANVKENPYKIITTSGKINISGLSNEKVNLFDLAGRSIHISNPAEIVVNPGAYIVKVNGYTSKVLVQ